MYTKTEKETTFDDSTPDQTPTTSIDLTYQQLHILYWVGCEFYENERSKKLCTILDKVREKLDNFDWDNMREKTQ